MRAIHQSLAVVVGLTVAILVFFFVDYTAQKFDLIDRKPSEFWLVAYIILCIIVPLLAGCIAACFVGKWRVAFAIKELRRFPRALLVFVAAAYILTWVFGVPTVQTATNAEAVDSYKRAKAEGGGRVWDVHPWIRTSAAFPLLPGLVASYHEYQVGGLDGWGGWTLHIWYFVGVKQIYQRTIWVS